MQLEARLDGEEDILEDLRLLLERVEDFRPVWKQAAQLWVSRQRQLFTAGKLPPLDPDTVRRKRGNRTPLVDTGKLRDATFRDSPVKQTQTQASFGIPKGSRERVRAILHQSGTKNMPRRDPVPKLTRGERARLTEMMRDYLLDGIETT